LHLFTDTPHSSSTNPNVLRQSASLPPHVAKLRLEF
jgi:hypothetical protein